MKIILAFVFFVSFAISASAQQPISANSKNWEFIVNNALRTLDERAVKKILMPFLLVQMSKQNF
ncbi:hypothetical protein [Teredinibacter turnerae]|uniref:hypothetical protein n=1 Tax=Teredinibacter turnerae TaxID=2426 RepID=UPI0030CC7864